MGKITDWKIGSDPEFIFIDSDGRARSIIGVIGGTKDMPIPIGKDIFMHEDNVLLELGLPPTDNPEELFASYQYAINFAEQMVMSYGMIGGFSTIESALFSIEDLSPRQAAEAGCQVDYNVWNKNVNEKPVLKDTLIRPAGGHLHLSWLNPDKHQVQPMVKIMDVFVGCRSAMKDETEHSISRRAFYGKAGTFRPKPYGFEYRTLSSRWFNSVDSVKQTFENVKDAIKFYNEGNEVEDSDYDQISKVINLHDKDSFNFINEKYIKKYEEERRALLAS